ncbi:ATP-dependent Clp protease ATP-binding subunit ClpA [Clostridium saccharobutylicum]|nr:ATP-dependent Clp protease ATP-binding subunit ClpA [Clostridium saccharobutylicum]
MKITDEVNNILLKAYEEAKERNSEYITPEHLLYAATFDENVEHAIKECGGSIENLRYNLKTYIKTYVNTTRNGEPQESIEFQRVILTANEQIKYSGKEAIGVDHILSAMFNLENSYALYYLQQEGVNRRDLLYLLCHEADTSNEEEISEYDEETHEDLEEEEIPSEPINSEEKTKKKKKMRFYTNSQLI